MHYQANFEFRDTEEGLRATETIDIGIGEDVYNALVESKVVEFCGKLFTWEDNASDGEHSAFVTMVETRPTAFGDFAGMAALSAPTPMTNPSTNPDTRLSDEQVADRIRMWFFRDLSTDQRMKLFALTGYPVDDTHGQQQPALKHLLQALRAPAETEPLGWYCEHGNGSIELVLWADARDRYAGLGYAITPLFAHPLRNPSPSDWEVSEDEIAHMVKAAKKKAPTYWSEVRDADIVWVKVIRAAFAALQSSKRG